jgi:hypothetical protein
MSSPTLCAILARFNFNRTDAVEYCEATAYDYPHLTREYRAHRDALLKDEEEVQAELDAENEYSNSFDEYLDYIEGAPEYWEEETQ